jgi:hypothetical protein
MIEVNSDNLWEVLKKLAIESKSKLAAVAYVTDDSYISFEKEDVLIVDASNEAIASGKTSAKILKTAFNKGAKIYSCDYLHAKVIIFGQKVYIGSANVSLNSVKNLVEIGIISDHLDILSGAIQFIEKIKSDSIYVDESFINSILTIPVIRKASPCKKRKDIHIEARYWMVSISNDYQYPGDEDAVENDNNKIEVSNGEIASWFWHKKGTTFFEHAKIGDFVVIIEREMRSESEPACAYRHIIISDITDDGQTKAYHYSFSDKYKTTWSTFKTLVDRAGISNLGAGLHTTRELTKDQSDLLLRLWDI